MNRYLLTTAQSLGLDGALIETRHIVTDPVYRSYCAENRCGQYDANYSCPPQCGSCEEMEARLRQHSHALVVRSSHPIAGYQDVAAIRTAKARHNEAMLTLCAQLREQGVPCLMCGASHCLLCEECAKASGEPCRDEVRRYSCLSAYCVNVAALAESASLPFAWSETELNLYGLIAF